MPSGFCVKKKAFQWLVRTRDEKYGLRERTRDIVKGFAVIFSRTGKMFRSTKNGIASANLAQDTQPSCFGMYAYDVKELWGRLLPQFWCFSLFQSMLQKNRTTGRGLARG